MIRGLTWRVAGLQDTEGSHSVYQSLAIKFYSNFVRHGLQSRWTRVIPHRFLARPRFLPLKPPASSHLSPLKIHQNLAQIVLNQINEQYYTNTGQNCNPWHPFGTNHIGSSKPHKTHHPKFWWQRNSPPQTTITNWSRSTQQKIMEPHKTRNYERDGDRIWVVATTTWIVVWPIKLSNNQWKPTSAWRHTGWHLQNPQKKFDSKLWRLESMSTMWGQGEILHAKIGALRFKLSFYIMGVLAFLFLWGRRKGLGFLFLGIWGILLKELNPLLPMRGSRVAKWPLLPIGQCSMLHDHAQSS